MPWLTLNAHHHPEGGYHYYSQFSEEETQATCSRSQSRERQSQESDPGELAPLHMLLTPLLAASQELVQKALPKALLLLGWGKQLVSCCSWLSFPAFSSQPLVALLSLTQSPDTSSASPHPMQHKVSSRASLEVSCHGNWVFTLPVPSEEPPMAACPGLLPTTPPIECQLPSSSWLLCTAPQMPRLNHKQTTSVPLYIALGSLVLSSPISEHAEPNKMFH